ncbi:hypothetical protein FGO68_gene6146 [Halteria grandinella]|uniref:Protein kinase domain-containing protein n=1 Tax=Halteria grandinella TaxID=5974 RepID=A0A8J8NC35_HALGN|nr:hypothetical protein FGO68_gene6146 [Halteria grandinella]
MSALCGTFGYIAPEQRPQSYISTAVDMYSFGILLHEMAVAYKPQFLSKKEGRLSFREADWRGMEKKKELQELICLCLRGNPKERPTAQEALEHEYYL